MIITKARGHAILDNIGDATVIVIGDVMLDKYVWGKVSRISPEAPVPVIDFVRESIHLGGAANVAANLVSLGVKTMLCGAIGDDEDGKLFRRNAEIQGIPTEGIIASDERITTVKTRIMGNKRHIARIDREITDEIDSKIATEMFRKIDKLKSIQGIIIEDYNKGVLSRNVIRQILTLAHNRMIPTYVDPKFNNFFEYQGVTVFKPNLSEAARALNLKLETKNNIISAGDELQRKLKAQNVLMTLGANGMMLIESLTEKSHIPTVARNVSDVSGAGDTTIATLAACISCGANIREAAEIANIAAGIVCEEPGVVSIKREEIFDYLIG